MKSLVARLVDMESFGVAVRISGYSDETKADGADAVLLAWVCKKEISWVEKFLVGESFVRFCG